MRCRRPTLEAERPSAPGLARRVPSTEDALSLRSLVDASTTADPRRAGDVSIAARLQLPDLGRGRHRLQHRNLDATHGPGLAGADAADPQQRHRAGRGHGAAVRATGAAVAADRFRRRPPGSAQAALRDAGRARPARARPGHPHHHRRRAAVAGRRLRLPARMRERVRRAGSPDLRVGPGATRPICRTRSRSTRRHSTPRA